MENNKKCPRCGRIYNSSDLLVCINCGSDLNILESDSHSNVSGSSKKTGVFSAYFNMFKRFGDYTSKSTRKEFWYAYLVDSVVQVILISLLIIIDRMAFLKPDNYETYVDLFSIIYNIFSIYTLVAFVARLPLMIRRLRDAGYKPVFVLLNFIPLVGSVIILFFMAKKSVVSSNAGSNLFDEDSF